MIARIILLVAALISFANPASAHRLDEYLQATTVLLEKDRIVLRLHLTPGEAVAPEVLAVIDANGDGLLSEAERAAYAELVRDDLALFVDGRPERPRLTASSFPTPSDMRAGVGVIQLAFEAALPGGTRAHQLTLENRHQSARAVYLVNTLQPSDPGVRILGQDRSIDQASYQLAFSTDGGFPVGAAEVQQDSGSTVATFFRAGVRHILGGYDHLLFLAALVLGARSLWDLVKVVTAFTIAHSITLTLAALDMVHIPAAVVEPLIAASIVCVALQNVLWPRSAHGASRLGLTFFFGLFHGLGFAGGLVELMQDLPRTTMLLAILGFSLGVEAGNQVVLVPLYGILTGLKSLPASMPLSTKTGLIRTTASLAVLAAGLFYCISTIRQFA